MQLTIVNETVLVIMAEFINASKRSANKVVFLRDR